MRCRQCKKRTNLETFCSKECKVRWLREKVSLQNQVTFRAKGKNFFKRKTAKISGPDLQSIWPKNKKSYEDISTR